MAENNLANRPKLSGKPFRDLSKYDKLELIYELMSRNVPTEEIEGLYSVFGDWQDFLRIDLIKGSDSALVELKR